MSFNWSSTSSSSSSLASIKPAASFADALKRLAEHVEERSRTSFPAETNEHGTASLLPSSVENRTSAAEQALRLYNQYTHEIERREDLRRCYLRAYAGSDSSQLNLSTMNRRLDIIDPYRFMVPHLSSLLPSPATHFPTLRVNETTSRSSTQESTEKKSEPSSSVSKPGLKLFRPYELDDPNLKSRSSSTKKSTSLEETRSVVPLGKEKQLFNSLGLVQQPTDSIAAKISSNSDRPEISPSINASEESSSTDPASAKHEDDSDKSQLSVKTSSLKRKSIFLSYPEQSSSASRKQSRTDRMNKL